MEYFLKIYYTKDNIDNVCFIDLGFKYPTNLLEIDVVKDKINYITKNNGIIDTICLYEQDIIIRKTF